LKNEVNWNKKKTEQQAMNGFFRLPEINDPVCCLLKRIPVSNINPVLILLTALNEKISPVKNEIYRSSINEGKNWDSFSHRFMQHPLKTGKLVCK